MSCLSVGKPEWPSGLRQASETLFIEGGTQCDQMALLYIHIFGRLPQMKFFCPMLQILSNTNQIHLKCQRLLKFCQSGDVLPNLVTLVALKV